MRERLIALRERRAGLLARAAAERDVLEGWLVRADRFSRWTGTAAALLGELKRSPLLIAAGVALLVVLRPKRMLGLVIRGWSWWQFVRRARVWWHLLASQARASSAPQ